MNRILLFVLPLSLIFSSCNNTGRQEINAPDLNLSKDITAALDNQHEASVFPEINSESKISASTEKSVTNSVKKEAAKKISFRKLLNANVAFTENKGQLERFGNFHCTELDKVKYYSKAFSGTVYFANNGIGFGFKKGGLEANNTENVNARVNIPKDEFNATSGFYIEFLGCNKSADITGINQQTTKINYLKGSEPSRFITDISSYEQIRYNEIYKGIDLLYYNNDQQLKYDYIVDPKADVNQIKMHYKNVQDLSINENGELEIAIDWGVLYDKKPYSYQMIDGVQQEVNVVYKKINATTIGFEVKGKYDKTKELVIDPFTVQWSTYIGTSGPGADNGYIESTVVDNSGRVLGTGWSNSSFPIAASGNGYDKSQNGAEDVFVFRLQSNGATMDYVTYIGGGQWEVGTGIAVNSSGEICVTGYTQSFGQMNLVETSTTTLTMGMGPMNVNVAGIGAYGFGATIRLQNGANYMEGTITGFPNGTTITVTVTNVVGAGTFGSWQVFNIVQQAFPTTAGSIQPAKNGVNAIADIFYCELNGAGNTLNYSTHYGGASTDWALDLVLDNSNNAYITGRTESAGIASAGAFKTSYGGAYDTYIMKITSTGTLGYFTYIGGANDDIGKSVAVNNSGEAYITGMTGTTGLGTAGVFQTVNAGGNDAFVTRINSTGTALIYFSYLGGGSRDMGGAIKLINNDAVVLGTTVAGSSFPLMNAYSTGNAGDEAFLTRVNAAGTALVYSTYLGGNGTDNTKGADYLQYHKNGGMDIVQGKPVMAFGTASTAGLPLVSPFNFTALQNDGVTTYTYDGSTFKGGSLGDMFVMVLDSTAQTALYGSYYGGAENDYPTAGINLDRSNINGCIIIGGGVHSIPFPTTPGAFQTRRFNTINEDQHALVKICLTDILPVDYVSFRVNH
ncbi:MAG: hypothetical protein K2X86_09735, partial [Cytophagaceae bacterium]|nr:hypothetical protein [Cytophagaceae bacterium]